MTAPAFAPATAVEVAKYLGKLAHELDQNVSALETADRDSVEKRAAFDLAFSRAFVSATGSVDFRKHSSVIATERQRLDADVADALVRHLRRKVDALRVRIDVGRSYGAAVRAEVSLAGRDGTP